MRAAQPAAVTTSAAQRRQRLAWPRAGRQRAPLHDSDGTSQPARRRRLQRQAAGRPQCCSISPVVLDVDVCICMLHAVCSELLLRLQECMAAWLRLQECMAMGLRLQECMAARLLLQECMAVWLRLQECMAVWLHGCSLVSPRLDGHTVRPAAA